MRLSCSSFFVASSRSVLLSRSGTFLNKNYYSRNYHRSILRSVEKALFFSVKSLFLSCLADLVVDSVLYSIRSLIRRLSVGYLANLPLTEIQCYKWPLQCSEIITSLCFWCLERSCQCPGWYFLLYFCSLSFGTGLRPPTSPRIILGVNLEEEFTLIRLRRLSWYFLCESSSFPVSLSSVVLKRVIQTFVGFDAPSRERESADFALCLCAQDEIESGRNFFSNIKEVWSEISPR